MSFEDRPFQEPKAPSPADRRREPRLRFTRRCHLTIAAPGWAITPRPITGRTANITLNGMRIDELKAAAGQARQWSEAIAEDVELRVWIELPELQSFPSLPGHLVWVHEPRPEPDASADQAQPCSAGVFFSVFNDVERQAVQEIIDHLADAGQEEDT